MGMIHILRRLIPLRVLVSLKYPGVMKQLVRGRSNTEFRDLGYIVIDSQEWEDSDGWHYRISDTPMKPRP